MQIERLLRILGTDLQYLASQNAWNGLQYIGKAPSFVKMPVATVDPIHPHRSPNRLSLNQLPTHHAGWDYGLANKARHELCLTLLLQHSTKWSLYYPFQTFIWSKIASKSVKKRVQEFTLVRRNLKTTSPRPLFLCIFLQFHVQNLHGLKTQSMYQETPYIMYFCAVELPSI